MDSDMCGRRHRVGVGNFKEAEIDRAVERFEKDAAKRGLQVGSFTKLCAVCRSGARVEINRLLLSDISYKKIEESYGVSTRQMVRHYYQHLLKFARDKMKGRLFELTAQVKASKPFPFHASPQRQYEWVLRQYVLLLDRVILPRETKLSQSSFDKNLRMISEIGDTVKLVHNAPKGIYQEAQGIEDMGVEEFLTDEQKEILVEARIKRERNTKTLTRTI